MFGVFSAWGLVAKFYSKPVHWTIARFEQILQTAWYEVSETEQQLIVPDVRGAGLWEVLPFRVANRESVTVAYVLLPYANFAKRRVHRWSSHCEVPWVSPSCQQDSEAAGSVRDAEAI